jgi:hypothetical protein
MRIKGVVVIGGTADPGRGDRGAAVAVEHLRTDVSNTSRFYETKGLDFINLIISVPTSSTNTTK